MKVIVWQGYGKNNVYAVDTKEQFVKVKETMIEIAESCGYNIDELRCVKSPQGLEQWAADMADGDDNFESFEVTDVIV